MASEKYEIKGTIKLINATEQVSDKFKKRLIVITTADEKFPQTVPIEFTQDNCAKLDPFSLGEEVNISFNLRGNEFKGKYYVSLSGWKIEGGQAPF